MPKSLTIANIIDKNKIASNVAWVFALSVDVIDPDTGLYVETLRVCHNDEQLTIDGQVYTPFPFEIDIEEVAGELPSVSVKISDTTRQFQYLMQQYRGGLGFQVDVIIVAVPDSAQNIDLEPDLVDSYRVISASAEASGYTASWELGAENPLAIAVPRRVQSRDRCSHEYKSSSCAYAGPETSCTRTLDGTNGCRAKNNEANYGGLPGINAR